MSEHREAGCECHTPPVLLGVCVCGDSSDPAIRAEMLNE